MTWTFAIEREGAEAERVVLDAPATAGGSRADRVRLPGTPAAAMRLFAVAAGVIVQAAARGVRVGGRPVAPGTRRLLRPGERAEMDCAALALERSATDTRVAAAALLRDAAAGSEPIPGPRLVVLTGPRAGACHALRARLTLGRGRTADVRVPDRRASRVHALVTIDADGAAVEDLGSKNGLLLNGVRVDRRPWPLSPGDEIVMGETSLALEDPWAGSGADPAGPAPAPDGPARRGTPRHAAAALLLALCAAALALAAR